MGAVITTGFAELDKKFVTFDANVQRKAVRTATKAGAQKVLALYRALVPVDTGAMQAAAKVRALKRSRTRIGYEVIIDRVVLFARRAARLAQREKKAFMASARAAGLKAREASALEKGRTHSRPTFDPTGEGKFFYPAVVELGDSSTPAQRPLRAALYRNEKYVKDVFEARLRDAINEVSK